MSCAYVCIDLHHVPYAVPWLLGFYHTMYRYVCFLFRPKSILCCIVYISWVLSCVLRTISNVWRGFTFSGKIWEFSHIGVTPPLLLAPISSQIWYKGPFFLSMEHQLGPLPYRSAEYKQPNMLLPIWRSFHHFNFNPAIGSNASFENTLPQSTYRGRDENKGSVSALSAGVHTATLYVMVTKVKGGGGAPPSPSSQGWFFHHDEMYARNRLLPLCVHSVSVAISLLGEFP
jgi:hypothetical protein